MNLPISLSQDQKSQGGALARGVIRFIFSPQLLVSVDAIHLDQHLNDHEDNHEIFHDYLLCLRQN